MRILVTGASGFVGRALVPLLAARGHRVVAPSRAETGDIGPETEWSRLLAGADAVIHLAARVHVMQDKAPDPLAAFRRVNTAGTARLAAAAIEAGVSRFVLISSIKVNGEGSDRPYTAADRPAPQDPYGISKLEAEQAILDQADRLEAVILRPPIVYGPNVGGNFLRLLKLIDRGMPLPFGSVRNRRSLIAVDNLADAIAWALTGPPGIYLPSDGIDLSTPALVEGLARAMGRPTRLLPCPPRLLRLAGAMTRQTAAIDRLTGTLTVDNRLPGWRPPLSVEDGLSTVAKWFCSASPTPDRQSEPSGTTPPQPPAR